MTIDVYRCNGDVYFFRCAPLGRTVSSPRYRAEVYRVIAGRKLQQVLDADGRAVEAQAASADDVLTRLREELEARLGSRVTPVPAFLIDGYVLHGSYCLPGARAAAAPR